MNKKRVSELTLTNFRCFKKATFDLDADIVIITGKNGSGKSTILYALTNILNERSTYSILNDIGDLKNTESKEEGYKIHAKFKNNEKEWEEKITSEEYAKDDDKSFRKEKLTTFFQEYISDYDLKWLMSYIETFENGNEIRIRNLQNKKIYWIKELKDKFLVSNIEKYEYRKDFLRKWVNNINTLSNKLRKKYFQVFEGVELDKNNYEKIFKEFCKQNNIELNKEEDFYIIIEKIKEFIEKISRNVNKDKNILSEFLKYFDKTVIKVQTVDDFKEILQSEYIHEKNLFFFDEKIFEKVLNEIKLLDKEIKELEKEYEKLLELFFVFNLENYEGSFEDIVSYFKKIKEKIKTVDIKLLPKKVTEWVSYTDIYELEREYKDWKEEVEEKMELRKGIMSQKRRILNALKEGLDFTRKFNTHFEGRNLVIGKTVSDILEKENLKINNDMFIFKSLIELLKNQITYEQELKEKLRKKAKFEGKEKEISSIINAVEKILNVELKDSIFNSVMTELPKNELDKIEKTINTLLILFHLPRSILPLKLEIKTRRGNRYYTLKTSNKESYEQLSTGQKAILNIVFGVAANLLFEKELDHDVIMFDDITTSLDLSQIIPAAILFRKLAYTGRRQVILTTHHEDLTNKLLDYLIPPEGYVLKVIEFNDWPNESKAINTSFNVYKLENKSKKIDKVDIMSIKKLIEEDYLNKIEDKEKFFQQ
ncbi:MAG: hypothetical protein PWP54_815 [Thermosipho sp. (in: thermotogales)]|nr:hypothetical protein [Thermosipho sp. (in: thermotogales)]